MADLSSQLLRNYPRLATAALFLPRDNPTFGNPSWDEADGRILIVRLSPFRDAEPSLAHLFLFQEARRAFPKGFVDLSFFPAAADRRIFDRDGIPYLFGLQSLRPAADFDLLLISNSCLLELINLPLVLIRSGLPVWSRERDDRHPLIVMGGSNATAAGSIVGTDGESMVDGIFFGEGEEQAGPLLESLRESRGKDRKARLREAAARVPAFWAAGGFPEKVVEKAVVRACGPAEEVHGLTRIGTNGPRQGPAKFNREFTRIDAKETGSGLEGDHEERRDGGVDPLPAYPVLNGEEADTARLAISRGCPFSCSFCFEGYDRRPYRETPGKEVLAAALDLKRNQGARNLEAMSFTFNAHREIFELIAVLHALFDRVGFKSQRTDLLASRAGLLEAELASGKRSFTLGIEGVSERLRAFLNKSLDTAAIGEVLDGLIRRKAREIKLFYLLTGYEREEDLREFREFVSVLASRRRRSGASTRVIFSFGYLVRMPMTPLRYDRLFLEEGEWKMIVEEAFAACAAAGFESRLAMEWDDYCVSQALALVGGQLAEALVAFARRGFCYDGSLSRGCWKALRGWLAERGLWNRDFLGEKAAGRAFPLSFLRSRVNTDLLYREYLRIRPGNSAEEDGEKKTGRDPAAAVGARAYAPFDAPSRDCLGRLEGLVREKARIKTSYHRVRLGREFAGLVPAAVEALILRRLFAARPGLAETVLSAREALFSAAALGGRFAGVWGETVVGVRALARDGMDDMDGMDNLDLGGGLRLMGPVPSFAPGIFHQAGAAIRVGEGFSDPRRRFEEHLKKCRIAFHLIREGGGYRLEIAEKSRKNLLYSGRFREGEGFEAEIVCGPRFDLAGLLSALEGGGHPGAVGAEVRTLVL